MNTGSDDVTLASYTVTGGGPVLSANLDMNTGTVSDATSYAVTTPSSQGLVTTVASPLAFDNILRKEGINTMTTGGDILFPIITDSAGQVDAFRLPQYPGLLSATPTSSGNGFLAYDSTAKLLQLWDGAQWTYNVGAVASTPALINIADYVAGLAGVTANNCVYISASGTVLPADKAAESTARTIGFAVNTAASTVAVRVQEDGTMAGFTGLTSGARYYLGTAGAIQTAITSTPGEEIVQVGYSASATKLKISFQHLGIRS